METDRPAIETAWPLGKHTTALVLPESIAEWWAVQGAWQDAGARTELRILVFAAALGLCDPELRGYLAKPSRDLKWPGARFDGDIRAFGAAVMQYLLHALPPENRPSPQQVWNAGDSATAMCLRAAGDSSSEKALKEATDFSSPPSGASSASSSTSSSSGGWVSAGSGSLSPDKSPG